MPFAVNDIIQVRIVTHYDTQTAYIVRHYVVASVAGNLAESTFLEEVEDTFKEPLLDCLAFAAQYQGVDMKKVAPGGAGNLFTRTAGAANGDEENNLLPPQCQGLIQLQSVSVATVLARGRVYVPFPTHSFCGPTGHPTAGYITKLQAFADTFEASIGVIAGGDALTITPVIYHRAAGTWHGITNATASNEFATQRRRGFRDAADAAWPPLV